jgi:hypothetical protein
MGSTTPSVETLIAAESGRRLVSSLGRHEVAAKVLTDTEGNEYLVLRAWVGSHPGPKATAGWSEPSCWQHIVLDDDLDIVAVGTGARERDSFEMIKRALRSKGITAGGGEGSRTKHYDPEFDQVGNETLKYWLAYWRDDSRSPDGDDRGPREWHVGKIESELRARGHLDEPDDAAALKARSTRPGGDDEALTPERKAVHKESKPPQRPRVKGLTSPVFDGVGTPDLRYWLKWWSAPERSPDGAEEKGRDPVAEQKKIKAEIHAREQKPNEYVDAMDRRLPGSGWSNQR